MLKLQTWTGICVNLPFRRLCQIEIAKNTIRDCVSAKTDADTFGNYTEVRSQFDSTKDDPEDIKEDRRKKIMDRKSPAAYIDMVKTHLNKHQYTKAINILEERMLKVDRVKPDSYIYDLLISYCGRIGDVNEAYRLYNQIKKRGYTVTGGQYTSIFNACANSRKSYVALDIASKVRTFLSADNVHKINIKNYNAMLKAFGRHGDLKTALKIVDEVLEKRGKIRDDTYNFLLQACIADPNSGFRHALFTWHRMLQHKTDPSVFTFNLLLRATRDCNLGDPDQIQDLLNTIQKESNSRFLRKLSVLPASSVLPPAETIKAPPLSPSISAAIDEIRVGDQRFDEAEDEVPKTGANNTSVVSFGAVEPVNKNSQETLQENSKKEIEFVSLRQELSVNLPNMIAIKPKAGSFASLASFKSSYHRLLLMGGVTGFLAVMDSTGIQPDIKTFTLLLEIIPSTPEAESDLMGIIKTKRIPIDTGFYNVLMKKRCFRFDYSGAKDVLRLMQHTGVKVDLITFGILAMTCQTRNEAEEFIANVRDAGYRLNSEMLTPLLRRATYLGDLHLGLYLLRAIKEDDIQPSPKLMSLLHKFVETHKIKLD